MSQILISKKCLIFTHRAHHKRKTNKKLSGQILLVNKLRIVCYCRPRVIHDIDDVQVIIRSAGYIICI